MSKADWYGDMGYVNAKDNRDEMLERKKLLQKQFATACMKKTGAVSNNKVDYSYATKAGITQVKEDKDVYIDENKIKSLKLEIRKLKDDCQRSKKSCFELKNDNSSLRKSNDALKKDKHLMEKRCNDLKDENVRLIQEIELLKRTINKSVVWKVKKENSILKNKVNRLQYNLRAANKELQNYQLLRKGELESDVVKKLQIRVKARQSETIHLREKVEIAEETISLLNARLLDKKASKIKAKVKRAFAEAKVKEVDNSNEEYGFISLDSKGNLVFVNINNSPKNITNVRNVKNVKKCIGFPARAKMIDVNTVELDCIYYNFADKQENLSTVKNRDSLRVRDSKSMNSYSINEFSNKRVLLVGGRNKGKYVLALKNRGADVVWHDAFEENELRLYDKGKSADVVVVLTSHVSHSVIRKLETLDDYCSGGAVSVKYQMLEKDNVTNIISRVRYSIENFNLNVRNSPIF